MIWTIPQIKIEPNGLTITNCYYNDSGGSTPPRNKYSSPSELSGLLDAILLNQRSINFPCSSAFVEVPAKSVIVQNKGVYSNFSHQSRQRLRRAFNLLIATSSVKYFENPKTHQKNSFLLNFITLTLSAKQGIITDYEIKKKLLNDFLTRLRQQKGLDRYIWRSEPQKNGNLHFHIVTNQYFDLTYIRDTWNSVQKKLGLIDLFNDKHHHINPNSTDIHSVLNIQNSGKYISKYLSKVKDADRLIVGKLWDCSLNLKPRLKCNIIGYGDDLKFICMLEEAFSARLYQGEHFKFIPMSLKEMLTYLPQRWLSQYQSYLQTVNPSFILN